MKIFKKILFPSIRVMIYLTIISIYGLFSVFTNDLENTWIAYVLYSISAYTLSISIFNLIYYWEKIKISILKNKFVYMIKNNSFINKYYQDIVYRKHISLYNGVMINLIFALFKYLIGIMYSSMWTLSIAIYYTMLCIIKLNLIRSLHKAERISDLYEGKKHEIINYIRTGMMLFALNATMSGMVIQMIWQNKSYTYAGYIIYIIAFYTFYSFITITIHVIKNRKHNHLILHASDLVGLAGAFMSLFILQTAMITQFGSDPIFQRIMNIITGSFIMIIVLFIAIMMVIIGIKKLNSLNKNRGI